MAAAGEGALEVFDLRAGFILRHAVLLLKETFELFPFSFDTVEVVIRELPPVILKFAAKLLPVAFDLIPVHTKFLSPHPCIKKDRECLVKTV